MKTSRKKTTTATQEDVEKAVVLRNYPVGEKDLLVIIVGQSSGRLAIWSRGARSRNSKLAALSEPFTVASYALKKGVKYTHIRQGKIISDNRHIRDNTENYYGASVIAEIADKAIAGEESASEYFNLLSASLRMLENMEVHDVLELYALEFLKISGVLPERWADYRVHLQQKRHSRPHTSKEKSKKIEEIMRYMSSTLEIDVHSWQMYKTMFRPG